MARRGRSYWKGFLRLSLVTIPIEMYNAVETKNEINFRQIHKASGRRVQYRKVVEGVGEIDNADIVKGYEVDKDTYVTMEPEEIDALKLESKRTIDLVQFVDAEDIDYRFFERPYFLTPDGDIASEGYVVIRDSLRKSGKVALGQVVVSGREWLVAIAPVQDGLVMEMLRYAEELRDPADYFSDVPKAKPQKEMVDLAMKLIASKSGPFKPEAFVDHYGSALRELVDEKRKGHAIISKDEGRPTGAKVINLMEALKKSVEAKSTPEKPRPSRKRAS